MSHIAAIFKYTRGGVVQTKLAKASRRRHNHQPPAMPPPCPHKTLECTFYRFMQLLSQFCLRLGTEQIGGLLGDIKLVTNSTDLPDTLDGQYNSAQKTIYIHPRIVAGDFSLAIKTMLHEIAHVLSPRDTNHGEEFHAAFQNTTFVYNHFFRHAPGPAKPRIPKAPKHKSATARPPAPSKKPCGKHRRKSIGF